MVWYGTAPGDAAHINIINKQVDKQQVSRPRAGGTPSESQGLPVI
jgi:hypothetical protein